MILCFGELLLRLSAPGRELVMQSGRFDVHVGGAEANVAVGLANLGHGAAMVSVVPDNPLGRGAVAAIRAQGVDCSRITTRDGRMGLYFLSPGAGLRASDIVYDRAGSSFATAPAEAWDWDALLVGCTRLHLSGITPALGDETARAAIAAAEAARARGLIISFDGNYRARLWEAWDSDPRGVLTRLVGLADLLFGNHRDVSLLLGAEFSGDGEQRRREAAEAAFAAFPNLRHIASTARHVDDADRHRLSARIDTPSGAVQTAEVAISGIVDRIGGGDAFASGVLHGLMSGKDEATAANWGLAVAALKHSLPGDFSLFRQSDIDAFLAGGLDVRR
ncbi:MULTISPECIES: sugar kinase [unclassified Sphingomonas]|uniref:sugar kinase n=1 Tax=unclassified Sphingomonas TaxID=196159 RepID=UPI0006FC6654|nr:MULTISPECIES: sugar kinase [unclassified Sphingomonas]KQM67061.1 2-keto-3-deoxygluconate kinase [Sphingomonas sp. Leaf16]KQN17995.1 2-keto-3-deoxygluconate kinase [Sphingomonas sp. Leaf29]KQN23506.1 2-keto-3-deoxygluconate kinase [Sphingomonas sp. Leaf32]